MKFLLAIHKDKSSDYGVTVPDLPGCFSSGETIDQAIEASREAIECHLEGMITDGESIPVLKSIEERKKNPLFKNAILALIDIDTSKLIGPSERINITVPKLVLNRMDAFAKRASLHRSTFIANAAIEYINNHESEFLPMRKKKLQSA